VEIHAHFSPKIDTAPPALASALRPYLLPGDALETGLTWKHPTAIVRTEEPGRALRALVDFAGSRSVDVWISASPHDRIVEAIERLRQDLTAAAKTAR
jgi:hypothetical protein